MKIETITGGHITSLTVYPWGGSTSMNDVVRISLADMRDNPERGWQVFVDALRSLPAGFYTFVVLENGYKQDIRVGRRGGVTVRPYDGKTINTTHQRPCLRIEVEKTFRAEFATSGNSPFSRWDESATSG
jgi:hypothetical protein